MNSGDITLASVVGAFMSVLGGAWALVRYLNGRIDSVAQHTESLVSVSEERQSKLRHDAVNAIHVAIARLDLGLEQLRREAVRREEMSQLEARFGSRLEKIETRLEKMGEMLPMIVERLDGLKHANQQILERNRRVDNERDA
jgi:CII-binding regulator of phage lambda lysogenization HflD